MPTHPQRDTHRTSGDHVEIVDPISIFAFSLPLTVTVRWILTRIHQELDYHHRKTGSQVQAEADQRPAQSRLLGCRRGYAAVVRASMKRLRRVNFKSGIFLSPADRALRQPSATTDHTARPIAPNTKLFIGYSHTSGHLPLYHEAMILVREEVRDEASTRVFLV